MSYTPPNLLLYFLFKFPRVFVRIYPSLLVLLSVASICAGLTGCGSSGTGNSNGGTGNSGNNPGNALTSISSILPSTVAVGSAATTLHVYGSNFNSGTAVLWNGASLTTTYVNNGEVSAAVPASNLSIAANVQITVLNSGTNTGSSAPVSFLVANPKPILNTISPQFANVGDPLTITATGSYLLPGTQIQWNGNALNTSAVNSTTLTAQVPSSNFTGQQL